MILKYFQQMLRSGFFKVFQGPDSGP